MKKLRLAALSASAVAMATASVPANSATIILNDIGGVSGGGAFVGFQTAARYWESVLADNVTINLNVGFTRLRPGVLGSARSFGGVELVADTYAAMAADATSALDAQAVANLRPLSANGGVGAIIPGYVSGNLGADTTNPTFDNDDSANNVVIFSNNAVRKALGQETDGSVLDGQISFNSDFNWDFDPTDGVTPGSFDFIGVAIHEIGHVLGFVSGVDTYDIVGCPAGPLCADYADVDLGQFAIAENLDLFRYSGQGELNWTPGQESYLSVDGGATQLLGEAGLSTGRFNGDGWQASHWKAPGTCSNFIGIMNPYLCRSTTSEVHANDLAAFDIIGWDVNFDVLQNQDYMITTGQIFEQLAPVPEPSTWLQMILGFGLLGAFMRSARRRRDTGLATA